MATEHKTAELTEIEQFRLKHGLALKEEQQ
jgi:hypothetical protein